MKLKKILLIILLFSLIFWGATNVSLASNDIIVALDPGHGGDDPGAMGGNLKEKDLTWKIASRVKQILDNTPGITGVLTKSENETLDSREERAKRAKNNNADLLMSFHINSNGSSDSLSGAEVYITRNTSQKRYYEYSNILGLDILENLRNIGIPSFSPKPITVKGADWDVYPDGTVADYYGIISWPIHMDIPAILIEHAFINNPYDRNNYLNDTMLNKIAEADAKAIIENKELFRRTYYGDINTDLKTMKLEKNSAGKYMISGNILIAEWIDGIAEVPKDLPKMTLKSTDGTYSAGMYVRHEDGLNYYYDRVIDNLDMNKEYYIEVELTSSKNLSNNKKQNAKLPKIDVGIFNNKTIMLRDNKLIFSDGEYKGEINTDLKTIELEEKYISGNISISEWIDGEANTPKKLPELYLKSTDGLTKQKVDIEYLEGISYMYKISVDNIDLSKQYYIEAKLISSDNISDKKTQTVKLPNKELGKYEGRTIKLEDNKIKFTYNGEINTDLKTMSIIEKNGKHYIEGDILIAEWIEGTAYEPQGLPEMMLKATDDSYTQKIELEHQEGLDYKYSVEVENLNPLKEYEIETKLTGENNIGSKKNQIAKLVEKEVGKYGAVRIYTEDNKIKIEDSSLYNGEINTDLTEIKIELNEAGKEYIKGNIIIAEWIDGVAYEPQGLPEMTLKSTDGEYSAGMYVRHEGGMNYYYDRVIYNLDTSKEYYIEVKLTGENNIGDKKVQKANIRSQTNIGKLKDKEMVVNNNILSFQGNEYNGEINTDLTEIKIELNEAGKEYIKGNIIIAEWINGVAYEPQGLPEMTLKSTDGEYSAGMYVRHEGGMNYYYDRVIYNLDTSKEYYIEVKLTGENNIGNKKVQKANIRSQTNIGKQKDKEMVVNNNILSFKGNEYNGEINTDLTEIKIELNEAGKEYIKGNIIIAEWINGVAYEPQGLPEMTLKSTDGEYSAGMYVRHEGGMSYYYDRVIYNLDPSKEYYIEVKLTGENNIGNKKVQKANIREQEEIGKLNNCEMKIINNNIVFEKETREIEKNAIEMQVEEVKKQEEQEKKEEVKVEEKQDKKEEQEVQVTDEEEKEQEVVEKIESDDKEYEENTVNVQETK